MSHVRCRASSISARSPAVLAPRSLYVHVPFCARRCGYCDFAVHATREPPVFAWLEAITNELGILVRERGWPVPLELDTIYVGGGTPSLLGVGAMQELAARLARFARWDAAEFEWTCEANPESFTPELARDWAAAGVNRVSLGVQSFDARALRWMGRLHGPDGPRRAVEAARTAGLSNVSIDLIFGLPARIERDWANDLARALLLAPAHISLYGLTAEPGAPLGRWVTSRRETLPGDDRYSDEYLLAHRVLTDAGFEHYEVSNFARAGMRSRHNQAYWTGAPYAALGTGAHYFDPPLRRWNQRDWHAYRAALAAGSLPVDGEERLDAAAAAMERIWLGLRTSAGLRATGLGERQRALAERWRAAGHAAADPGRVRLTATGWLLLDSLALEMANVAEDG